MHAAAVGVVPSTALTRWLHGVRAPGVTLRIGILGGGPSANERHNGALLGVEEARQAARLFGGSVKLVPVAEPTRIPTGLSAILGDEDEKHYRLLTRGDRSARGAHALVMNVGATADTLRGGECAGSLFHVYPSDAMLGDARADAPGATDVVAWDPDLARFGADTLNGRFTARFSAPMTPYAWAAWFAVKALWESSLRMKSSEPSVLAEYLVRDTTQFDGHKGRPLSFRAWDRQLRQFLYARVQGKLVDVPRNAPADLRSRAFLDRLGTGASESKCHATS